MPMDYRSMDTCDEHPAPGDEAFPVLLVEDSPTNRRLTRAVLSKAGCDVTAVESGEAALDELGQRIATGDSTFQLILLDYQLPGINGAQTAKQLTSLLKDQAPPMIGLTGHVNVSVVQTCRDAGMRAVLRKPVKRRHMEAIVARLRRMTATHGE